MAARKPAPPPTVAEVHGFKCIIAPGTGELNPRKIAVRNVNEVVHRAYPNALFRLVLKRNGELISAHGPIAAHNLELCYPGCETDEDIAEAEHALHAAGLTKGITPSGRALDLAQRMNPRMRQWRVSLLHMQAFQDALYGGYQFGKPSKPGFTTDAEGREHWEPGMYQADIVSSYPYLAAQALPVVACAMFQRGWQPGAVLVHLTHGTQWPLRLFSREGDMPTKRHDVSGWYVAEEIEYLRDTGVLRQVEVDKCVTFREHEEFLRPVVEHLAAFKADAPNALQRTTVKVALNGLIGKFAQRMSPWRAPRTNEDLAKCTTLRIGANTLVLDAHQATLYPRTSNVVWTALTNARARVRLWQKMDEVHRAGGEVLWAHTDAVIARVPDTYQPTSGLALGEWRTLTRTYHHTRGHAP